MEFDFDDVEPLDKSHLLCGQCERVAPAISGTPKLVTDITEPLFRIAPGLKKAHIFVTFFAANKKF
jgi:hypothetical protein